jgi:hypothetical protein
MRLDARPPLHSPIISAKAHGEACIANIGPGERRRRMRFGLVTWAVGAISLVAMLALGVDWWFRLLLFLPFVGGASGFFQARDQT